MKKYIFALLVSFIFPSMISNSTFQLAFEFSNEKIVFICTSNSKITLWKLSEDGQTLHPCDYDIKKRKCIDFVLPIAIQYSKTYSIKMYYHKFINEIVYTFDGEEGYMCVRSYIRPIICHELAPELGATYIRTNKMEEFFIFYGAHIVGNEMKLVLHQINGSNDYSFEQKKIIDSPSIIDFKYQSKQNCIFYGETMYKLECFTKYMDEDLGNLQFILSSGPPAIIESKGDSIYILINQEMIILKYEAGIENRLPTPEAQHQLNAGYRYEMKIGATSLYFLADNGVSVHSQADFIQEELITFPSELNLSQIQIEMEEIDERVILFEKLSNKVYIFPEVIFDEEEEEYEEEIEFEEPSLPENSVQFIKVCPIGCLKCNDDSTDICEECKFTYALNEDNHCKRSTESEALVFFTNVFNVLRPTNIQSVFFAFVNFDLYNLHKTEYSGFFSEAITFANTMEEDVWNILPFEAVKKEIKEPFNIQSYFPYTNEKFIGLKGTDSFFFQSTKAYFQLYVPITLFVFVFIRVLRKYSITVRKVKFLKTFSFWLNFLFMTILQNSQYLCIYAVTHFLNFFTFNLQTKILSGFCLYTIFFIFIVLVTLTPIILYEYKDECHSFLSNLRYHNLSIVFMGLKYILKPFVESMFHILLFEHSLLQKCSLIALSFLSICVFVYIETKYSLSQTKTLFWLQTFEESVIILLYIVLIFRYEITTNFQEIEIMFDFCIEKVTYFFIFLLILEISHEFLAFLGDIYIFVIKIIKQITFNHENSSSEESSKKIAEAQPKIHNIYKKIFMRKQTNFK